MTTTSPWGPQDGPPQPPSSSTPPNPGMPNSGPPVGAAVQGGAFGPPPKGPGTVSWGLLAAFTGIVFVAIAATAAITYAIARNDDSAHSSVASSPQPPTDASAPVASGEGAAAKAQLCQVFDDATRGKNSQGAIVSEGILNVPVVLRALNDVAVLQNSLTSNVPDQVAGAARAFIDAELQLTTAATGNAPIDELVRLNDQTNKASDQLSDACGLPR